VSFTFKIRLFLILAALLPPLVMTAAIYHHSTGQEANRDYRSAVENLERYHAFRTEQWSELLYNSEKLAQSEYLRNIAVDIHSGRTQRLDFPGGLIYFDFIELLDDSGKISASATRPGIIGERLPVLDRIKTEGTPRTIETVEIDHNGRHASIACLIPVTEKIMLYTGKYLDRSEIEMLSNLLNAEVEIVFSNDANERIFSGMNYNQVFQYSDTLLAVLSGSEEAGYLLTAAFRQTQKNALFVSLMRTAGTVGLAGIAIAILFGIFITGQAKKEIDNLIKAAGRISSGDYRTPVMAYEEGEFARLADAFTGMMFNIRKTQEKLTMSEKIAAWKAIGQKIAHEIKNPLTPIEISVDDLRRSYREKLPGFEKTVETTTAVIKTETARLKKLLNNFVEFARMAPPEYRDAKIKTILDDIASLYRAEIDRGRLKIENVVLEKSIKMDPDKIKQMLLNLIKNGLEADPSAEVIVSVTGDKGELQFRVADTGPGFSEKILNEGIRPYVSTKKEGSGLGLVICQRIAFDHNGTLEITNNENGGGVVIVTIPIQ